MRTEEEIKKQHEKHIQTKHDYYGSETLRIYYAMRDVFDWVLGLREEAP